MTRKTILSESSVLLESKIEMCKKRKWVDDINLTQESEGKFQTLFDKLRRNENKFYKYCRLDEKLSI